MAATKLADFRDRLNAALKDAGLIPMSAGVTHSTGTATTYQDALTETLAEVDKASTSFSSRTLDRYSTEVGSSYRDRRWKLITGFENVKSTAYPDGNNTAIGVGFNMDRGDAKQIWQAALGDSVSFEDAKAGRASITPAQAKALFDHDILTFEAVVDKAAGGRKLTQNQRLALVSVAYSTPSRVLRNSSLIQNGSNEQIMDFILHNSFNPGHSQVEGIKKRRYAEASLFGSLTASNDIMPSFDAYNEAVKVDSKTGEVSIRHRLVAGKSAEHADMLDKEFQGRLNDLFESAPESIRKDLGIYSGYRSVERQKELWDAALLKYGSPAAARKWVAPPGKSNHNHGLAADLSYKGQSLARAPKEVVEWVHQNAPKFGLSFPLSNENWHVEPIEVRQGKPLVPRTRLAPMPVAMSLVAPTPLPRTDGDTARLRAAVSGVGLVDPSKVPPEPADAYQRITARNNAAFRADQPAWMKVAPKPLPSTQGMMARANAAGLMFIKSGRAEQIRDSSNARYRQLHPNDTRYSVAQSQPKPERRWVGLGAQSLVSD